MKKVGIITITHGTNYGNRLQNFATQKVMEDLGFNAETIYNFYGNLSNKELIYRKFKKVIKYIFLSYLNLINKFISIKNKKWYKLYAKLKRNQTFTKFNSKYIKFSKFQTSGTKIPLELNSNYDYFVCGSDQIWNPYHSQSANLYFLTFTDYGKSIAFSPSLGVNDFPNKMKQSYIKWLSQIKYLSVREKAGADIINQLTGRNVEVLVDPTLLLDKNEWLEISRKALCKPKNKYILVYFLGNKEKNYINRIKNIAKKNNMGIFNLLDINDVEKYSIDPSEFIDLIKDASLVCTDSFHGTVFSIIMKVPFIVFERKGKEVSMNSRIETLLSLFNLNSRLDKNVTPDKQIFNVNYENVDSILKIEKLKSIQYLKDAIM
ncbi:polysaccharide pyruvyl transferase family protein [Clostridium tyrobutyricum]|uniref:polysaccharide pyruvyl transferase family protein n=1 Tax=Clostridium tyrobutyricum TaxID=1519 RepID=UPI001C393C7D|nr:polysaccharide pyruvyl transferase family protein [Clostridium tyrobutyricum]MBV4423557.1 polysaccharide pyruvyl transferase family protein [Clostridium tyrobutyricum]